MRLAVLLVATIALSSPAYAQTQERGQRVMAMADTNRDGAISFEEFQAIRLRLFERADANADAFLTGEELSIMQQSRQSVRLNGASLDMSRLDTNSDARVSRDEFSATGQAAFDRLDQNRDGSLNQADRAQ